MKIQKVSYSYTHKKMGDLQVGEFVVGPSGEKYKILEIQDHGVQDVYRIYLSDGRFFDSMASHLSTVHFRNSHTRPSKKVYDTVTTKYIIDHLKSFLFEIPTDETFDWSELDYPQFLEMLPLHEYEPISQDCIIPDLERSVHKVYIDKIEKVRRENCRCISLGYPWGLYLIEEGIITHNSLLSNLVLSYILVHFCLMREPYRLLGHSSMTSYSQPHGTLVQLVDNSWKCIEDLKVGDKIRPVLDEESEIINIIDQGLQDTYELDFGENQKVRCSLSHWWLVWDFTKEMYVKIQTKDLIADANRYGIPEKEDIIRDRDLIVKCQKDFEKGRTSYDMSFSILKLEDVQEC